jgi:isoquinoline 1-oxidoreductase alpha subunit
MIKLEVNGRPVELDVDPQMPLLWALRDEIGLTGTKYGCGQGLCGACTVLLDGDAVRSCTVPLSAIDGRRITTIEAEAVDRVGKAVQDAWVVENVAQCGYCQPGQVMSAIALLAAHPKPTDEQIDAAMSGNLCRCGTYLRIRTAIHRAAAALG